MNEEPRTQDLPATFPPAVAQPETETTADDEAEAEWDDLQDIPEPDLEDFKDKSDPELEEEILFLAPKYSRNRDALGIRIYELNKRYKSSDKKKGTGITAFLERLNGRLDPNGDKPGTPYWNRNRWSYWVRNYTPAPIRKQQAEDNLKKKLARQEKEAGSQPTKRKKKYPDLWDREDPEPNPPNEKLENKEKETVPEEKPIQNKAADPTPFFENSNKSPTLEDVRAVVKKCLAGLSRQKQLEQLTDLGHWIVGQIADLEEELKSQKVA